jgi:chromosome segregation ATPase
MSMANVSDNKTNDTMCFFPYVVPCGVTRILVPVAPSMQPLPFTLSSEYDKLKKTIEDNEKTISDLKSKADLLRDEKEKNEAIIKILELSNSEYKIKIDALTEKNIELTKIIGYLDGQIEKLQEQIKDQNIAHKKEILNLNTRISGLEEDIKQLKDRDDPITVREAFVALERSMLIELTGSKKKARYFNGIKDLFDKNQNTQECDAFLS